MYDRDIVREHGIAAITGSRCGKLSRIRAHACTNRDGKREREREKENEEDRRVGGQSEFSQKRVPVVATTRNQLHRSRGAAPRCNSHNRMYYEGRNRMLNAVNPLKPCTSQT
jgi:hypothetical protein